MKRIGLVALFILSMTMMYTRAINTDSLRNALKEEIAAKSDDLRQQQKDSLMLSKLSGEQLMELKKQEMELEKKRIEKDAGSDMPLGPAGIVIICMLPFVMVIGIILINARARGAESKRRYDIYMKSLEMGQAVPEHFFDEPERKKGPSSNLKRGVICMAVGLALVVAFLVRRNDGLLIGGIIPAFIGAGYLLVHYLEKPNNNQASDTND